MTRRPDRIVNRSRGDAGPNGVAALPGALPVDPGLEADRGGLQRPRCLTTLPTMLLGRSAGFDRAAGVSELSEAADLTAWVVTIADVPVGRLVVVTAGRVGSAHPPQVTTPSIRYNDPRLDRLKAVSMARATRARYWPRVSGSSIPSGTMARDRDWESNAGMCAKDCNHFGGVRRERLRMTPDEGEPLESGGGMAGWGRDVMRRAVTAEPVTDLLAIEPVPDVEELRADPGRRAPRARRRPAARLNGPSSGCSAATRRISWPATTAS